MFINTKRKWYLLWCKIIYIIYLPYLNVYLKSYGKFNDLNSIFEIEFSNKFEEVVNSYNKKLIRNFLNGIHSTHHVQ